MASKDLLEGLFDAEREAEDIVEAARAEARRRIEEANASSRREAEETRERALSEARRAEAAEAAAIDAELAERLDAFEKALEGSRLDRIAFDLACGRAIEELYPR